MKKYSLPESIKSSLVMSEDKTRFIQQLEPYMDNGEYDVIITFFETHPNLERKISWQKINKDPTNVLQQIYDLMKSTKDKKEKNNSKREIYRQPPDFEQHDCKVIKETERYVFVAPLSWEGAKYLDSTECGGAGATWCIGYSEDIKYWNKYVLKSKSSFVCVFDKAVKPNPAARKKYMVEILKKSYAIRIWSPGNDDDVFDAPLQDFEDGTVKNTAALEDYFKYEATPIDREAITDFCQELDASIIKAAIQIGNGIREADFKSILSTPYSWPNNVEDRDECIRMYDEFLKWVGEHNHYDAERYIASIKSYYLEGTMAHRDVFEDYHLEVANLIANAGSLTDCFIDWLTKNGFAKRVHDTYRLFIEVELLKPINPANIKDRSVQSYVITGPCCDNEYDRPESYQIYTDDIYNSFCDEAALPEIIRKANLIRMWFTNMCFVIDNAFFNEERLAKFKIANHDTPLNDCLDSPRKSNGSVSYVDPTESPEVYIRETLKIS